MPSLGWQCEFTPASLESANSHPARQGLSVHSAGTGPRSHRPGPRVGRNTEEPNKEHSRKVYGLSVRSSVQRALSNNTIDSRPLGAPRGLIFLTDVLAIPLEMKFMFKSDLYKAGASVHFHIIFLSGKRNVCNLQRYFPPDFRYF